MVSYFEGRDKCEFRQTRPVPLKFGRIDCIPDEDAKWTPYPFEVELFLQIRNTSVILPLSNKFMCTVFDGLVKPNGWTWAKSKSSFG